MVRTREVRSNHELRFWEFPLAGAEALVRLPIPCREPEAHAIRANNFALPREVITLLPVADV
eukprot:2728315-Pyramimonas_sp.AAC.1